MADGLHTDTLSARGLIWREPVRDEKAISDYARKTGLNAVLAAFLWQRGISPNELDVFLKPTLRALCPDPASFQDMEKAARHIAEAILDKRHVCVFADYDVDGATSASQLNRYFRHFGHKLDYYVPDRLKEGYGPSPEAFQHLKDKGVELVITVDCGAAAEKALAHARNIDLPIIVLDHHLMSADIPETIALVNPNRPDDRSGQGHLAAAGVVFVLLVALNQYFKETGKPQGELPDLLSYLDLCALGTLCDITPVKGAHRAFVIQGLKVIQRDESVALKALAEASETRPPRTVTDLTFGIGPQLNAGGRIGDPWLATELMTETREAPARALAKELHGLNEQRKAVERDITEAARKQTEDILSKTPDRKVLIAMGEGWHPGVLGIVAGRLKDEYHRPVITIGHGAEFGPLAKGSARSVPGMNIGEAISAAARKGLITSGGGHAMAGGLAMEAGALDPLAAFLEARFDGADAALAEARTLQIDMDILPASLTHEMADIIEQAGPYGVGAKKPLFRIQGMIVRYVKIIGEQHLKLTLGDEGGRFQAMSWRGANGPLRELCQIGAKLDVIGYIDRNAWQGWQSVQFEVIDARAA